VTSASDQFALVVEDDGSGGADVSRGTGLRGLRDRLEALGGSLAVTDRVAGGTSLVATLPRARESAPVAGAVGAPHRGEPLGAPGR